MDIMKVTTNNIDLSNNPRIEGTLMLSNKGKRITCSCGCNCFGKHEKDNEGWQVYGCNSCGGALEMR